MLLVELACHRDRQKWPTATTTVAAEREFAYVICLIAGKNRSGRRIPAHIIVIAMISLSLCDFCAFLPLAESVWFPEQNPPQ